MNELMQQLRVETLRTRLAAREQEVRDLKEAIAILTWCYLCDRPKNDCACEVEK